MRQLTDIIKPTWIRLTHADGSFWCEFDPERGIAKSVNRGGTAFHDIPAIIEEWHRANGTFGEKSADKAEAK